MWPVGAKHECAEAPPTVCVECAEDVGDPDEMYTCENGCGTMNMCSSCATLCPCDDIPDDFDEPDEAWENL